MRRLRHFLIALLVMTLVPLTGAWAQRLTGSATVQVLDPTGKAISDVQATLASKDRGTSVALTGSPDGTVTIPEVPPGEYQLTLKHDGFKTTTATLTIRVGTTTSLEIRMELGSVSSAVIVEASAQTVDTIKSTVQGVIQAQQIESLPLNGRNFLDLAQQAPGVQVVDGGTFDPTKNQMVGVSIAGRSGRSTRIQVDGVDITDETVGTTVMNLSNEAIQEFGLQQSSLDVSTDLTSSGAINIITRSGTNTFHGSGFGFFRRSAFAANNAPLGLDNPAKPEFSRDSYGGRLGGPFIRDKWFWEAEYEKHQQLGQNTTNVPLFPQFTGSFGVPVDEHLGGGRTDFNLTANQRLFYRYNHDDNIGVTGFGGVGLSAFANSNRTNSHVAGWDFTHGAWVHQVRFSYLKFLNGIVDGNALAGTPTAVDPAGDQAQINITGLGGFLYGPNILAPQNTYQENKQLKYDGSWTHGKHTISLGIAYNRIADFGYFSFFKLGPRVVAPKTALAADPFNGNGASDPLNYQLSRVIYGNGLGFGSEKPGFGQPYGTLYNNRLGIYAHDTWRASRTLTINAGLRYDRDDGLTNHDLPRAPLISAFDPELGQTPRNDNMRLGPQAGFAWNINGDGKTVIRGGGGIYYEGNIFNNISFDRALNIPPGLGVAYPTVDGSLPFLLDPVSGNVLFNMTTDCTGVAPGTSNPDSCFNASIGAALPFIEQFQAMFQQQSAQLAANWPPPGIPIEFNSDLGTDFLSASLIDPHYHSPYASQFNIGVERQLKQGLVLSVDYIMTRGVHINTTRDRNRLGAANTLNVAAAQAAIARTLADCGVTTIDKAIASCASEDGDPASIFDFSAEGLGSGRVPFSSVAPAFGGDNRNFGQMSVFEQSGLSRYQALQVSLTGRLGTWGPFRNVMSTMNYALSRYKATGTDSDFLPATVNNDVPNAFYGPSDQDRTHQLGVSFIVDLPFNFRIASATYYRSNAPSDLLLFDATGGDSGNIFLTDLDGDGTVTDPMPGTNHGSFDRGVSASQLEGRIDSFNSRVAGSLTPAGQALVSAGLFTEAQLSALGAVIPAIPDAPAGQLNNPNFFTSDIRISWAWKFKERLSVEPMVDCFNIFNRNNWAGAEANNGLTGGLSGGPGTVNGTAEKFQRVGNGSGSFSSGTPRAFQFGIRVSF